MKKTINFFLILSLLVISLYSEDYTIIVKSKKDDKGPKKDILTIEKSNFHYTLDQLLEKEGGILIQKYGGEGSYSLVRIRGSNGNQVQIHIDGIPLHFGSYSEVDLSDLHIMNYQSIQIQKNGIMNELTGSSIGGSINLIPNYYNRENQIWIQGGSYKTFGGGFLYTKLINKDHQIKNDSSNLKEDLPSSIINGGITISFYKETSDQNYQFRNHNGTIYFNTLDDYNDVRKNAQYKKTSGMITSFYKFSNTEIRFLNDSFYRIHGLPGSITKQTEKTKREHLRNTTGIFTDTKNLIENFFNLKTRIFYTYINNHFKDPKNELAFGANQSEAFMNNKGLHLMPEVMIFDSSFFSYRLKLLGGYEEERFNEDKYTAFNQKLIDLGEKKRFHYSGHWYNQWIFFNGFLEILPEFRYEEYKNNFYIEPKVKQTTPVEELKKDESKINFINDSYQMILNFDHHKKNTKIFIKYNNEKRIPSFIELFGEKGSIVPNLNLNPEQSYNVEIGFLYQNEHLLLDVRGYQKKVRNLIRFLPNSQFSLRAENIEKASIKGIEFTLKYKLEEIFQFYYVYQYMEAIKINKKLNSQKNSYIPLLPLHTAKSGISIFPEKTFELQLEIQYFGAFFRNESNDYFSFVKNKWIYNFSSFYRYEKKLLVFLEVRNLQNSLAEDVIGYPLPGRSYQMGLKYFFD